MQVRLSSGRDSYQRSKKPAYCLLSACVQFHDRHDLAVNFVRHKQYQCCRRGRLFGSRLSSLKLSADRCLLRDTAPICRRHRRPHSSELCSHPSLNKLSFPGKSFLCIRAASLVSVKDSTSPAHCPLRNPTSITLFRSWGTPKFLLLSTCHATSYPNSSSVLRMT